MMIRDASKRGVHDRGFELGRPGQRSMMPERASLTAQLQLALQRALSSSNGHGSNGNGHGNGDGSGGSSRGGSGHGSESRLHENGAGSVGAASSDGGSPSPATSGSTDPVWQEDRSYEQEQRRQNLAYLEHMLTDGAGLKDPDEMEVTGLLAYQVMHNELADMIGDVATRLDFSDSDSPSVRASSGDGIVDEWISSVLSASLPQTPDDCVPDLPSPSSPLLLQADAFPPDKFSILVPENGHRAGRGQGDAAHAKTEPDPAAQVLGFDDVKFVVMECAKAVLEDDVHTANRLARYMREFATPYGSSLQRLTHYVMDALLAKLYGTGADLYTAQNNGQLTTMPSQKVHELMSTRNPKSRLGYQFAYSVFLEAFEGADSVHIIDYGIMAGGQWPGLLQALANRPGGPPKVRITGIELPHPGLNPDEKIKETGRLLCQVAASLGINFQFKGFADKWEKVQISSLGIRGDEVLAVCCMYRLRNLLDESVVASNPRRTVLERIARMKPKVFVTGIMNAALNTPLLMARIPEILSHGAAYFDILESSMSDLPAERLCVEQELMGRFLLNVVACEGLARMERSEAYYQWHRRLANAGLQCVPMKQNLFDSSSELLRDYHRNWTLGEDRGWMLLGWKNTVMQAYSAWEPVRLPTAGKISFRNLK